jgi:hypothetical protein
MKIKLTSIFLKLFLTALLILFIFYLLLNRININLKNNSKLSLFVD